MASRRMTDRLAICVSPVAAVAGVPMELSAAADLLWSERHWPVRIGLGAEAQPPAVLTLVAPERPGGTQVHIDVAAWRVTVAELGLLEARRTLAGAVDQMVRLPRQLRPGVVTGVILVDRRLIASRRRIAAEIVAATMRER